MQIKTTAFSLIVLIGLATAQTQEARNAPIYLKYGDQFSSTILETDSETESIVKKIENGQMCIAEKDIEKSEVTAKTEKDQPTTTAKKDTLQRRYSVQDIYRAAYIIARRDGSIDDRERAVLDTLQSTLVLSPDDVARIKDYVKANLATPIDQSGRWPLVLQNMAYGAGMYGWMIPYVLEAKDVKWTIGAEMMSLASAFYLTYKYTKNMEIPHSRSQMMRLGSLIGLRYGFGINTCFDLMDEGRTWAWILMASVPVGTYVGDLLYKRWQPTNGESWVLSLGSEMAGYTIRELHQMLVPMRRDPKEPIYDPESEEYQQWEKEYAEWEVEQSRWEKDYKKWLKPHTVLDMVGYPLGLYLTRRYFLDNNYTFGDALMLIQGRALGLTYGLMTAEMLAMDFDKEAYRIFPLIGSFGGVLFYDRFIDGYDYTFGHSILSFLGTGSGMAFMGGCAVIFEIENRKVLESMVMAGGIAGLYLSNSILDLQKESKKEASAQNVSLALIPGVRYENRHYVISPTITVDIRF